MATTTFTVTGTDANGCKNTDEVIVDVNPLPNVSLKDFKMICIDAEPLELTGGVPTGGVYLISSGVATHFDPKAATAGTHVITYEYKDAATGCTNKANKDIVVDPCTGVENAVFARFTVKVYPNPAYNHFNLQITAPEKEEVEVMIFNSNGKLIANEKLSLETGINKVAFNSSQYARGIYIMRVVTKGGVFNQRVVLN